MKKDIVLPNDSVKENPDAKPGCYALPRIPLALLDSYRCGLERGHDGDHKAMVKDRLRWHDEPAEQSEEPPGTVIKEDCVSLTPRLMFSILHGPGTDAAKGYDAINPAVKEGWEKLALFVERMTRQMIAQKQTIQAESDTK